MEEEKEAMRFLQPHESSLVDGFPCGYMGRMEDWVEDYNFYENFISNMRYMKDSFPAYRSITSYYLNYEPIEMGDDINRAFRLPEEVAEDIRWSLNDKGGALYKEVLFLQRKESGGEVC